MISNLGNVYQETIKQNQLPESKISNQGNMFQLPYKICFLFPNYGRVVSPNLQSSSKLSLPINNIQNLISHRLSRICSPQKKQSALGSHHHSQQFFQGSRGDRYKMGCFSFYMLILLSFTTLYQSYFHNTHHICTNGPN